MPTKKGKQSALASPAIRSMVVSLDPNDLASYRDKLLGYGVDNNIALLFSTILDYIEEESDVDNDPKNDAPIVLLSKAEKQRIHVCFDDKSFLSQIPWI